ncbi:MULTISPECIES: MFS transporter [unclassified Coleofasciculus]|uniref:MFS transporter n=1 Tax=unclassified Coleofasciculus TaxID=2692782 RepID=UPI0018804BC5|nr:MULTISPECIES: MFS transporter [unclassified Coleofasciculus]MBE9126694.1 MFS transporter [Coleofasciculus sp. LEGE 07081]MBE9150788.1 MFS transporter [Coleofasciculus sp. LEGE 07092]
MKKTPLNFWQLLNMSVGFFGIQFGWGLQMANMSAIFEYLGANAHQIPILWLAAPLTGLIVQPIIGNMSDNTWGRLGRRRPYFLIGAILGSIALVLMPHASALWMAAGLLWILDTSANISMEPFRAFVGDLLPKSQRTRGFAMQSLFIGLGAVIASALPWVLNNVFHIPSLGGHEGAIPLTVELSFYIGAAFFFGTVLWTVLTTEEYPPKNLAAFEKEQAERGGIISTFQEIWSAMQNIPSVMKQLAWVQCFTWFGMFCFFLYFPPAVAWNIFGATNQQSLLYNDGIEWAGICIAVYNAVCFIFSLLLPRLAKLTSRQLAHGFCLLCGAGGFISLAAIDNKYLLFLSMVGVGIAWASILTMPYAMLIGGLPSKRTGIYLGIFNFFIVLPQIAVSLGFGWVMDHWLDNNRLLAVVIGGGFLLVAAVLTQRVQLESVVDVPKPQMNLSEETAMKT